MVAKGDDDKPTLVPPLILERKNEIRRFVEAMKRKELKLSFNTKMDKAKNELALNDTTDILKGQRCIVNLES